MRRTLWMALLLTTALVAPALLAGCQAKAVSCNATGCDLQVSTGEPQRIMDGAELVVKEILVDTALVEIDGESGEIVAGTTGAVGGLRVTVVSVDGQRAHLLVAP